MYFSLQKHECVNDYLKIGATHGFYWDSERLPVSYLTEVLHHICLMQDAHCSARFHESLAISRNGKNSSYWVEYFPFQKLFRRKMKVANFITPKHLIELHSLMNAAERNLSRIQSTFILRKKLNFWRCRTSLWPLLQNLFQNDRCVKFCDAFQKGSVQDQSNWVAQLNNSQTYF